MEGDIKIYFAAQKKMIDFAENRDEGERKRKERGKGQGRRISDGIFEKIYQKEYGVESGAEERRDYSADLEGLRNEMRAGMKELRNLINMDRPKSGGTEPYQVLDKIGDGLKAIGDGMKSLKSLEGVGGDIKEGLESGFDKISDAISRTGINVSGRSESVGSMDVGGKGVGAKGADAFGDDEFVGSSSL